jgi:transposase
MGKHGKYPQEMHERAVRLVFETQGEYSSQTAAIKSIAQKVGCAFDTLRRWVRKAEREQGYHGGQSADERQRVKDLEREVRELRRANEILRKASAYFAQAELDRRPR